MKGSRFKEEQIVRALPIISNAGMMTIFEIVEPEIVQLVFNGCGRQFRLLAMRDSRLPGATFRARIALLDQILYLLGPDPRLPPSIHGHSISAPDPGTYHDYAEFLRTASP